MSCTLSTGNCCCQCLARHYSACTAADVSPLPLLPLPPPLLLPWLTAPLLPLLWDCSWERREAYNRLDELKVEIEKATNKICRDLLDSADVVGVTCTGAAGPEL